MFQFKIFRLRPFRHLPQLTKKDDRIFADKRFATDQSQGCGCVKNSTKLRRGRMFIDVVFQSSTAEWCGATNWAQARQR